MNSSNEQTRIEQELTNEVIASFKNAEDQRLKYLLEKLVEQLHEYIREVRLTENEWQQAIEFLTAVGHITTDTRQEFILLSDVLGASMQTIAVNNPASQNATEATVFGPFFVEDSPQVEFGGDISGGAKGQPAFVEGTVKDTNGNPIPGARIEVWECDEDGFYDVQYEGHETMARAHLYSDAGGEYAFWGLTPVPYPIPHDGPVGKLLAATGRSPLRAAHLHFMVEAEGYRTLVTHIFVEGDQQLVEGDAVFGVKDSLIKQFEPKNSANRDLPPHGKEVEGDWSHVRFDIVLVPES